VPPGYRVLIYEMKQQRMNTFSPHGQDGWYIGTAPHHYRYH